VSLSPFGSWRPGRVCCIVIALAMISSSPAVQGDEPLTSLRASVPEEALDVVSLGQPAGHTEFWGATTGWQIKDNQWQSRIFANATGRMAIPQMGALSLTAELSLLYDNLVLGGAAGMYFNFLGFKQGMEYNALDDHVWFRFSADVAMRRGGLFGHGERLRVDYEPGTHTVLLGLTLRWPLTEYLANRPRLDYVPMSRVRFKPVPPPSASEYAEDLERLRAVILELEARLTPTLARENLDTKKGRSRFETSVASLSGIESEPRDPFSVADSAYHTLLDRIFVTSVPDSVLGLRVANIARRCLLSELVIPVNRLFGQNKKPFRFDAYAVAARACFAKQLVDQFSLWSDATVSAALAAFDATARAILDAAGQAKVRWKDERLVWLPLNYGLRPEQYDTQGEMEEVLSSLLDTPLTHSNQIQYLINDRWQYELERMIGETMHYQVLIIHDFQGNSTPEPDPIGWGHMAMAYMDAFIAAIKDKEAGVPRVIPQFAIFIDQHYYSANNSQQIMSYLENLFTADTLELNDSLLQGRVGARQAELRELALSATCLSGWDDEKRAARLRVHVNVTNTYDPAYHVDMLSRDHRKMAFRDVFEDDPGLGAALVTGQGVGAHYVGPCWEDRSLLLRGPVIAGFKDVVRDLFLSQGYDTTDLPYYYVPRPVGSDATANRTALRERGWFTHALLAINGTSFAPKMATVLKAALYNLVGPGTVIILPDSLWASDYWAGMIVSAAIRGCRVYAIAADRRTAASGADVTLDLVRNTLSVLVASSRILEDRLKASGGALRVGLYSQTADIQDLDASVAALLLAYAGTDRDIPPFSLSDASLEAFHEDRRRWASRPLVIRHLADVDVDCDAKLHLKAQFFANASAVQKLEQGDWSQLIEAWLDVREQEVAGTRLPSVGLRSDWVHQLGVTDESDLKDQTEAGARPIFMVTLGSHNQDRRSMFLDGESTALVCSQDAMVAALDFAFLVGASDWIDSIEELEPRFPRRTSLLRTISQWIRNLI
jgi:hypothetical protein